MAEPNRRRWTVVHVGSDGVRNISLEDDLQIAKSLADDGRYQEALDLLRRSHYMGDVQRIELLGLMENLDEVERNHCAVFCHTFASILTRTGEDAQAAEWYQRAIDASPGDAEPWSDKAGCLYRLGQYDQAIECARHATEANDQDELAWLWWAEPLAAVGDDTQALAVVDRGLGLMGNSQHLLTCKASLLAGSGRFKEAVELTNRVLRFDANDAAAWYKRGLYLGMLNDRVNALEAFRRAVELTPTNEHYRRELAVTLAVLGRPEAEAALQEALRLLPGDEVATLVLSSLYGARGEPERSLTYIERALLANPASRELLDLKDGVLRQLGK